MNLWPNKPYGEGPTGLGANAPAVYASLPNRTPTWLAKASLREATYCAHAAKRREAYALQDAVSDPTVAAWWVGAANREWLAVVVCLLSATNVPEL